VREKRIERCWGCGKRFRHRSDTYCYGCGHHVCLACVRKHGHERLGHHGKDSLEAKKEMEAKGK